MERKPVFPVACEANSTATFYEVEIKQENEIDIGPTSLQLPDICYGMSPSRTEQTDECSEITSHKDASLPTSTYEDDSNQQNAHNQQGVGDVDTRGTNTAQLKILDSHKIYYECAECGFETALKSELKSHIRKHEGESPNEKSLGPVKFGQSEYLADRTRFQIIRDDPYECSVTFKRIGRRKNGKRIKTGEKRYQCSMCGVKFRQNGNLKSHMAVHTSERPYECAECSMKFKLKARLRCHVKIHSGEKPYQCSICPAKFKRKDSLDYHVRYHTGVNLHECSVCSTKFVSNKQLVAHMRIHSDERPFECSECPVKFKRSCELRVHMKIHTDEKPYECSMCSVRFRHQIILKNHMKTHANEGGYECSVCLAKFNLNRTLKRHMNIHKAKNICSFPSIEFKRSAQMKDYTLHTDEKPHECSVCHMKFKHNGSLKSHVKTHADEKP